MALDLGLKRVGVAISISPANLPRPLVTLNNDQDLASNLKDIIKEHQIENIVIGLPRTLNGDETEQTKYVRRLAKQLGDDLGLDVELQDEALSSQRAEEDLRLQKNQQADKGLVDKLAACYILEDYLRK